MDQPTPAPQPPGEPAASQGPEPTPETSGSKVRLVAAAATVIALLALAVPFVWQHDEPAGTAPALTASHDATPADGSAAADGGACMADAQPAPLDFTLKNLDNEDVTLADYKGKVILLNFWATWCGPCKAEIPGFVELQEKYQDDLAILGFSVDDPADKARAFAEEYKINYPILLGLGHENVQDAYGPIWGIPTSFLIARDGTMCRKHMGIAPKATFEKEIQALL